MTILAQRRYPKKKAADNTLPDWQKWTDAVFSAQAYLGAVFYTPSLKKMKLHKKYIMRPPRKRRKITPFPHDSSTGYGISDRKRNKKNIKLIV